MYIVSFGEIAEQKRLDDFAIAVHNVLFSEIDHEFGINIYYIDNIEDDACGFCFLDDDNSINIEINSTLDTREAAITLAHEMVHARQLIQGFDFCEIEAYGLENSLTVQHFH
jgi:Zn-dependent peptidase ImmA (M78 family)